MAHHPGLEGGGGRRQGYVGGRRPPTYRAPAGVGAGYRVCSRSAVPSPPAARRAGSTAQRARMTAITPNTPAFQAASRVPVYRSTHGEMNSQAPRMTVSHEIPGVRGVARAIRATTTIAAPTIQASHAAAASE